MTKIKDIIGMWVFTDAGHRLDVTSIKGSPSNGATIERKDGVWEVIGGAEIQCET